VAVHGHTLGALDEFVQIDMATYSQAFERKHVVPLNTREALICEVQRGMVKGPRSLSPWVLYDGRGSRLFDCITTLPEYYPTRTERAILARNANAIITAVLAGTSQPLRIVELGAGSASKTEILLKAAVRAHSDVLYMPPDVSPDALYVACRSIECSYPEVRVEPRVVDYTTHPPQLEPFHGATLMLYLGSSIGNFSPEEARTILRNGSSQMRTKDAFLLGADLVKDESTLVAAYDDRAGVTAAFNINILHRLNRELGADFDPAGFRHCARWNA
jgi:L-histidine Nalpha-methyltransferase